MKILTSRWSPLLHCSAPTAYPCHSSHTLFLSPHSAQVGMEGEQLCRLSPKTLVCVSCPPFPLPALRHASQMPSTRKEPSQTLEIKGTIVLKAPHATNPLLLTAKRFKLPATVDCRWKWQEGSSNPSQTNS